MKLQYFTPREAATALGVRLDATYALIWTGRLAAEKKDGRWLVPRRAVEERIRQRGQKQGSPQGSKSGQMAEAGKARQ